MLGAYEDLLEDVLTHGSQRTDRTGTGTVSLFGTQTHYDIRDMTIPLITSKRVHWKSVVGELLWMISGSTNNNDLLARGVTIWNEWADEDGSLGPIYGAQWRSWDCGLEERALLMGRRLTRIQIDQLACVINKLKTDPMSRRHVVSAWNVGKIDEMALPPCHVLFQFYVSKNPDGGPDFLSCQLYQRSADLFLGVPFNIASYALLTHLIARITGLQALEFIHVIGDAHIYLDHMDQINEQLSRDFSDRAFPKISLATHKKDGTEIKTIDDFSEEDITLIGYNPLPVIKGAVSK